MKKILILILLVAALVVTATPAFAINQEPIWTNNQIAYHELANYARSLGYTDDSEIIQALQQLWWQE